MARRIALGDGKVHEFPDEATDDQIAAALNSTLAREQTTGWDRAGKLASETVGRGVSMALGLPGDLQRLAGVGGSQAIAWLAGMTPEQKKRFMESQQDDLEQFAMPGSQSFMKPLERQGMVNRPDTQVGKGEYPNLESLAVGAGSALIGGLPLGGFGGPVMLGNIVGGAGSELAHTMVPDSPELAMGAAIGGGLLGHRVGQWGQGSQIPRLAGSFGNSTSLQSAGESVQAAAKGWLSRMPAMESQAWAPLDTIFSAGSPGVPLTNFQAALTDLTNTGGTLSPVVKAMRSELPEKIEKALNQNTLAGLGLAMPWEDVRTVRSWLGQMMREPRSPIQSAGQDTLDTLYRGLSKDLEAAARAHSPEALEAFQYGNQQTSHLRSILEEHVAPLIEPGVLPEAAANKLLSGAKRGGTTLNALSAVAPEMMGELTAAQLHINPAAWNKLAPEARVALVGDAFKRAQIDRAVRGFENTRTVTKGDLRSLILGPELGAIGFGGAAHLLGNVDWQSPAALGYVLGGLAPLAGGLPTAARALGPALLTGANAGRAQEQSRPGK